MRSAIERNNPCGVDHFVENHDMVRSLRDLHVVVVRAGGHRRSGIETDDASAGERRLFWSVESSSSTIQCSNVPDFLLRFRRERRNLAVGWVDDEGRPIAA